MFLDVSGMPIEYEHLRTRLRIEQSRCLHWGQEVGLVEDMLDEPSKLLQLNHNLVLDILQEIQRSFRSCLAITSKYDPYLAAQGPNSQMTVSPQIRSTKNSPLQKVLALWERGGRLVGKVEWTMLRKDSFEELILRLIQYNDRIESFLDRSSLEDVREMQVQSNLMLLQMTDKVDSLRILVEAMQIDQGSNTDNSTSLSRSSTLVSRTVENDKSFVSLATFKAHYLKITMEPNPQKSLLIPFETIHFDGDPNYAGRQTAMLGQRPVWLEWRETADAFLKQRRYLQQIDERVQTLASILSAADKPTEFRSPKCIGYTKAEQEGKPRYALVHQNLDIGDGHTTEFVSLRERIEARRGMPSLNKRIELATTIATSVLYLHAVNWVHKDIRSDNILFMRETDQSARLSKPMLAGFEFSRPALPEEVTVTHQYTLEQALYRHPDLLTGSADRSNKSHDLYSLGLLLAEIALWTPIEDIAQVEVRRSKIIHVRSQMLDKQNGVPSWLAQRVGLKFCDATMSCLDGSLSAGVGGESNEESPEVSAEMARLLYESVVQKLKSIKI